MSLSMTSVHSLYMGVIDGVISGAREFFLDEGVDEQVLTELRHIWETRLKATKAIETKPDKPPQPPVINKPTTASKPSIPLSQYVMPSGAVSAPEIPAAKMVSIQITLPSPPQPGATTPPPPKYITIQVPASAMEGNQLQSLLTGPVISASMALSSTELATSLLQQHVNSHFAQQQQQLQQQNAGVIQQAQMSENDQAQSFLSQAQGGVRQVDGTRDTSDDDDDEENEEEDEAEEDDDDDLDDKDEEENDENDMGAEEEPLNSGDDVSEEDTLDMFETDNVVVCQYDKITRTRNKWKFYLKDGIMNLGGKDYVFQKSNGDAEW